MNLDRFTYEWWNERPEKNPELEAEIENESKDWEETKQTQNEHSTTETHTVDGAS